MKKVMVVAPHPDDETLGCGGTLFRLGSEGAELQWVVMTRMTRKAGYAAARIRAREGEIARVRRVFGFKTFHSLGFPAARLDAAPMAEIVEKLSKVLAKDRPSLLLVPGPGDAHSDHRVTFEAAMAAAKRFRTRHVERVLAYETPSETDAAPTAASRRFEANSFFDISAFMEKKLRAFALYKGEGGRPPFPRSPEAIRALATVRGAQGGFRFAEAFQVVREYW